MWITPVEYASLNTKNFHRAGIYLDKNAFIEDTNYTVESIFQGVKLNNSKNSPREGYPVKI
jgi:hypothetical protein